MRCEVGDLSGKNARLNVGYGKQFFTDSDLPLFGDMSGNIIFNTYTQKKEEAKYYTIEDKNCFQMRWSAQSISNQSVKD